MKHWLRIKFLLSILGILIVGGYYFSHSRAKAPSTNLGTVTRGDIVQRVTIAGTVIPNRKTIISAPYQGYVKKLYVQVGDQVQVGDPIVSVSQSLRGDGEDVYPLRAPFPGTVVQVLKTAGEYVEQQSAQGGNALVRVDDLSRIYVDASAPEMEVGKLMIGQEGVIKSSAIFDRTYKGRVKKISLAAKEQKEWEKTRVEFSVVLEVTNGDRQLKPGMSVIVDVITKKVTQILTLRHEFIQKDGEHYYVVTEAGDRKLIEVGNQNEEAFEVRKGLSEGERVRQTDFLAITKG